MLGTVSAVRRSRRSSARGKGPWGPSSKRWGWGRGVGAASVCLGLASLLIGGTFLGALGPHIAIYPKFMRGSSPAAPDQQRFGMESGLELWVSGLPPNASGHVVVDSYGPHGITGSMGGPAFDGFDWFTGPLSPGMYVLVAQAISGYIPNPATATYFVNASQAANEVLNVSTKYIPVDDAPMGSCYQVYTEVGLPLGTEWWVVGDSGLAFFSNGSIIDALGCGSLEDVTVGDSIGYALADFPSHGYYEGGSAVPVFFEAPPSKSTWILSSGDVALLGIVVGAMCAAGFSLRRSPSRWPDSNDLSVDRPDGQDENRPSTEPSGRVSEESSPPLEQYDGS